MKPSLFLGNISFPQLPLKRDDVKNIFKTITRDTIQCVSGSIAFVSCLSAVQTFSGILKIHSSSALGIPTILGSSAVAAGSMASVMAARASQDWVSEEHLRSPFSSNIMTQWQRGENSQGGDRRGAVVEVNAWHLKVAALGMVTFQLLGGRFYSVLPSEIRSPGAFRRPGPSGSLPATLRYAGGGERAALEALGRNLGCHTCGTTRPRAWVADHMPPIKHAEAANKRFWRRWTGRLVKQQFFPQCRGCSIKQGEMVKKGRQYLKFHFKSLRAYHLTGLVVAASWVCFSQADGQQPLQPLVQWTPPEDFLGSLKSCMKDIFHQAKEHYGRHARKDVFPPLQLVTETNVRDEGEKLEYR
eukprot:CAMPEP_0113952168 /NCGR_PEP_ID=MMETSP1339-20121228/90064_1 /TAXON_ID=94617 /ORGANISM="Fibrocapsa japonica" /LENGTH=356 /DNA_ID=CAMNT_0000960719 /DNA_START=51 /DNA_END=1121 /DNA_ORIENTATION=- /assembly_acc=CAM_ASM_000762